MPYGDKVLDHYEHPRNVGSLPKDDPDVGTGLVGAPACGDVMKLQIKVEEKESTCKDCNGKGAIVVETTCGCDPDPPTQQTTVVCETCKGSGKVAEETITDAKFKTFGCGSAIASSSLLTEWVKGMTLQQALGIKNTQIVAELSLPPIKIHCSVLAEDAIKAAIADLKRKRADRDTVKEKEETPVPDDENPK